MPGEVKMKPAKVQIEVAGEKNQEGILTSPWRPSGLTRVWAKFGLANGLVVLDSVVRHRAVPDRHCRIHVMAHEMNVEFFKHVYISGGRLMGRTGITTSSQGFVQPLELHSDLYHPWKGTMHFGMLISAPLWHIEHIKDILVKVFTCDQSCV